ncbi:MAG: DUF1559 domain-containing protein [Planctomycetota bacterium]
MVRGRLGLAEVLFLTGAACLALAYWTPPLMQLRESNRNWACQDNLRSLGVALDAYHDRHLCFPSGYSPADLNVDREGGMSWAHRVPSYAWSALILSELGYAEMHESLRVREGKLPEMLQDRSLSKILETPLPEFRCASDRLGDTMESSPLQANFKPLDRDRASVFGGASSYVANAGYFELHHPFYLAPPGKWTAQIIADTAPNNGIFFPTSRTHRRQVADGLSHTIAIGERGWYQGGSTWVGTANVRSAGVGDSGMCLGRVWWRINQLPQHKTSEMVSELPVLSTRVNQLQVSSPHTARNGFGSYHPFGANFLMADGSIRFLSDQIDFQNTIPAIGFSPTDPIPNPERLGLFQKLGIRNDSVLNARNESDAS